MTDQDRLALADRIKAVCSLGGYIIETRDAEMIVQALRALAQSGGEPVAWIARDPDGGPYLTWSKSAAHAFPNPTALYAAPIAGEPGAWRPIETAPRDGTAVLLTDCRIRDWTQVAFWDEDRPNGYVWARDDASTFWHRDSFTHWMPLPAPPAALASAPQPAAVGQHCACGQMVPMEEYEKLMWQLADAKEELAKATPPQPAAGEREEMRPKAFLAWAVEMFGPVAKLRSERLMRFIEEAIELAHADEMERHTLEAIANRVYARPKGTVNKEIGQAQACLETYAENIGESSDLLAELEWQRVQQIPRSEWERRHTAKQAIGIAEPSLMPARETGNADNVRT